MIKIIISADFSATPGGRYTKEGPYSGEEFRKKLLLPKFIEAVQNNTELEVNLDGCYGLPTSFLEEAFGGLVREIKDRNIIGRVKLVSEDEPGIIDLIKKYMNETEIKD